MKHILIIEDDTSIAELERDYLEANGITSEIVSNGELGLQKALHQDYDLILLVGMSVSPLREHPIMGRYLQLEIWKFIWIQDV